MVAHTSANGSRETLQLPTPNQAGGSPDPAFYSEPKAQRRAPPNAVVQILEAGHFALDTAADEIAQRIREFHEVAEPP